MSKRPKVSGSRIVGMPHATWAPTRAVRFVDRKAQNNLDACDAPLSEDDWDFEDTLGVI
jgi:hypothetical protein